MCCNIPTLSLKLTSVPATSELLGTPEKNLIQVINSNGSVQIMLVHNYLGMYFGCWLCLKTCTYRVSYSGGNPLNISEQFSV